MVGWLALAVITVACNCRRVKFSEINAVRSGDISIAKAKHATYYRRDTKFHETLLAKGNNIVLSLPNSMPIEGGVQLIYQNKSIGAIGISGAASIEDGLIAKAGADFLLSFKEQ